MVCQIQEKKALVLRVKPNNGGSPVRTGSKNSGGTGGWQGSQTGKGK